MNKTIKKNISKAICAAMAALICSSCFAEEEPTTPPETVTTPETITVTTTATTTAETTKPTETTSRPTDTTTAEKITTSSESTTTAESTTTQQTTTETPTTTEAPDVPPDKPAVDHGIYTAFADFSTGLMKNVCAKDIAAGKNVMISPESVLMALGMTSEGANGDTLAQMTKTMAGEADSQTMNETLQAIYKKGAENGELILNCANSVWANQSLDMTVKDEFAENIKRDYGAEITVAPFNGDTINSINDWVKTNTNDMIPSIIKDLDPAAAMVLVNAVAFEAQWSDPFNDYAVHNDGVFTNSSGEKETCTMLSGSEYGYFNDGKAQAFRKLYKGGKYSFMGILPNEDVSVSDYISELDGEGWYKLWDSRSSDEVIIKMPEFSSDYDAELTKSLIDMGMEKPFSDSADFSGMAEGTDGQLKIDSVLHKTHIEVDRYGTKAAAATAVFMVGCAADKPEPKYIALDRPFIYAIVDNETGFPLFIGAVNTVNK